MNNFKIVLNSKMADLFSSLDDDFDQDYEQGNLKISDINSKKLSKLGFSIFNIINSADDNYSTENDMLVSLDINYTLKLLKFVSLYKFIMENNLDITDKNSLKLDERGCKKLSKYITNSLNTGKNIIKVTA